MSEFRVAALFRYPLKSAGGMPCRSVELDRFGVSGDRRWMVIDADGDPLTQRELPALALLRARSSDPGLEIEWQGRTPGPDHPSSTSVARPAPDAARGPVTLWGDTVEVPRAGDAATEWITAVLGREAHLAYMPDDVVRPVNPRYARPDDLVSLSDGFPLHLIGSGSMANLNARLDEPVGVERFRPNIYVEGPAAFDEDEWSEVRIGGCTLRVVKPCARCAVTTVDPATGARGREPLRTLSRYRKREGGVMFGQNALHEGAGTLRVGDVVEVLRRRDSPAA